MAQGALGAAGVRHVGYELEVGRSVRAAGGWVGAYCVATRTACCYIVIRSAESVSVVIESCDRLYKHMLLLLYACRCDISVIIIYFFCTQKFSQ